jgi:hypothetical protein
MHGDIEQEISSLQVVYDNLDAGLSSLAYEDFDYDTDISSLSVYQDGIVSSLEYFEAENTGQYINDISSLQVETGFIGDAISSLSYEDELNDNEMAVLSGKMHDLAEDINILKSYWNNHKPSSKVRQLAQRVYDEEIGFETGDARTTEISLIGDWLEGHLGELNSLIFTSFSGYDPQGFNLEEQAILRELYLSEYNRKAHRRVLRGIDGSNGAPDFQVIKEGDSMIQKSNKNVTAKSYRDAYVDSQERVKSLVHSYNLYGAKPSQVAGADAPVSGQNDGLYTYYN